MAETGCKLFVAFDALHSKISPDAIANLVTTIDKMDEKELMELDEMQVDKRVVPNVHLRCLLVQRALHDNMKNALARWCTAQHVQQHPCPLVECLLVKELDWALSFILDMKPKYPIDDSTRVLRALRDDHCPDVVHRILQCCTLPPKQ